MESQHYEGLFIFDDQPKYLIHGLEYSDDGRLRNFVEFLSPQKHTQSVATASTAARVQDAEGRKCSGTLYQVR